jgi:ubiquinone/menaquinone biosynthesis C-methylase UbiE
MKDRFVEGLLRFCDAVPEPSFASEDDLASDLRALSRTLGIAGITANDLTAHPSASAYYTEYEPEYRMNHSPDGSMHFGLSRDGRFRQDDFYEHPRRIETDFRAAQASRVLELASGKGFNTAFLAKRNPNVQFAGVDLTPLNIELSETRAQGLTNVTFHHGDYHALPFEDASFDFAFETEAACYSDSPDKHDALLSGLARVLRPHAKVVFYDFFRPDDFASRSQDQQTSVEMVEKVWVTRQFFSVAAWATAAERAGFRVDSSEDFHVMIMPSVRRLYRRARLVLLAPRRLGLMIKPPGYNWVSALMLPYAFALGACQYRRVEFTRVP